jgi:F0F1-type ATP synthase assembly protein I
VVQWRLVTQDPNSKPRPPALTTPQIASLVAQTGCLVLVAVFVFLGAGIGLDRLLHTKPLFTLLLLVGSMPLTMYVLYRITLRTAARILPPEEKVRRADDRHDENP